MKKWLIVSPHPDDAELGMGGYIARAREENPDLHITLLVVALSAYEDKQGALLTRSQRRHEQAQAAKVLTVDEVIHLELKDNDLFNMSRAELVSYIEEEKDRVKPDELFIPLPSFNQDHVAVYDACITGLRPTQGNFQPPLVWAYEYPGNCWGPNPYTENCGRCYVRLENRHMAVKMESLRCYPSQMSPGDTAVLSFHGVRALAVMRGAECDSKFAEVFRLIKEVY